MTSRTALAGRLALVGAAVVLEGTAVSQERSANSGTPITSAEKMVDVGGRRLHCFVYGSGAPAVVLVSGLDSPQESWAPVIPALAAETTVVTYDRAGVGKSEIGSLPTHGEQSGRDLHALLEALEVPKPYLLVGHSYGGFVSRLFASAYPDEVAGLILEETQHEDNLAEIRALLKGKDREAFEQSFGDMLRTPVDPKTEADFRSITREQLRNSRALPSIPFLVLTCRDRAKAMPPVFSDEALEAIARLDVELMNRLAGAIPGGRHVLVECTSHYFHVDEPRLLTVPLLEMIRDLRSKSREHRQQRPR